MCFYLCGCLALSAVQNVREHSNDANVLSYCLSVNSDCLQAMKIYVWEKLGVLLCRLYSVGRLLIRSNFVYVYNQAFPVLNFCSTFYVKDY